MSRALADRDRLLLDHRLAVLGIRGVRHGRRVAQADLPRQPALRDLVCQHAADVTATDDANLLQHDVSPFPGSQALTWLRVRGRTVGITGVAAPPTTPEF